ncbi:hypothetical protein [Streptomyces uncialis]|uniref:Uncharacterized protein n=1 Tax=Streptomyces uncialis TaxID=1048205 RepID=A0A1Q4UXZ1_9ACTN|nr:hypothetical protein [Streptomyces uncialis]OKH90457.1 hypothetical protein AB852_35405 [Streptomyces uncialis]
MLNVTRETKGTLTVKGGGRVLAWHNDKERGVLSVAIPGDRVKLTPDEARVLAAWLIDAAKAVEVPDRSPLRAARLAEGVSRW